MLKNVSPSHKKMDVVIECITSNQWKNHENFINPAKGKKGGKKKETKKFLVKKK